MDSVYLNKRGYFLTSFSKEIKGECYQHQDRSLDSATNAEIKLQRAARKYTLEVKEG